jgi:hypothetical protein
LSPCEVWTQQARSNLEVLLKVRRVMEEAKVSYHDFISKIYVITQILMNYSFLEIIVLSIVESDWILQSPYFWMRYFAIEVLIDSVQMKAFKNLNFRVEEMLGIVTIYPFNRQNRYFRNESCQLSKISFDFI